MLVKGMLVKGKKRAKSIIGKKNKEKYEMSVWTSLQTREEHLASPKFAVHFPTAH